MKPYTYSGVIKDKNIREALDIVLSGKKLEYNIDKEFITITTKGPSKQAKVYTVNGVVLSADDGEPAYRSYRYGERYFYRCADGYGR